MWGDWNEGRMGRVECAHFRTEEILTPRQTGGGGRQTEWIGDGRKDDNR